jgi:hypothetical protein
MYQEKCIREVSSFPWILHIILICIQRASAHKCHIFRFLCVSFTYRFDCINFKGITIIVATCYYRAGKPTKAYMVLQKHGCPTPQCKYLMARCCMDINKWGFIISYHIFRFLCVSFTYRFDCINFKGITIIYMVLSRILIISFEWPVYTFVQ